MPVDLLVLGFFVIGALLLALVAGQSIGRGRALLATDAHVPAAEARWTA